MKQFLFILFFLLITEFVTNPINSSNRFKTEEKSCDINKKEFQKFLYNIAYQESSYTIDTINEYGYLGKYQFSPNTLRDLGYTGTFKNFLNNERLQDRYMLKYLRFNDQIINIQKWAGKTIDSVKITRSGILASCHLGGAGSTRLWLRSNGTKNIKDSYGTSIKSYMKKFSNYKIKLNDNG